MRSSATKTWLHCYYETKTRANGSVIAEVASPALAAYRLLPRTAAMCSPEDDCMPLHDVVVERGAVDALGRICLHALEVAHQTSPCCGRHRSGDSFTQDVTLAQDEPRWPCSL